MRAAAAGQLYEGPPRPFSVGGGNGRFDLSAACGRAMRLLAEGAHACEDVSARAGISVQTVELIADYMSLHGAAADGGWESLPDAVRFSAIKSECYPTPPRRAWVMARLMSEGATAPDTAVDMPVDRAMRELVGAGHVRRSGSRFYLAGIGPSLAQGVLSMYPEHGRPAFSRCGGVRRLARRLVGEVAGLSPPSTTAGGRKGAHAR